MQLLLLMLLLMSGGSAEGGKQLPQGEGLSALAGMLGGKELQPLLSALTAFPSPRAPSRKPETPQNAAPPCGGGAEQDCGFSSRPLAPIAAVADENITSCLSRYISCGV